MRRKPWRIHLLAALALALAALLLGCGSDTLPGLNRDFEEDPTSAGHPAARGFVANFDLTGGIVPSANNLLFSGSQDGTLNIPIPEGDPAAALKATLNALDGFSTNVPVTTTFSEAVDPASLTPSTVRVFEVALAGIAGAVTGITRELAFGVEFVAAPSSVDLTGRTLAVVPLQPLKPKTSYLVALTNGIRSTDGRSAMAADHYLTAKTVPHDLTGSPAGALEPVRRLVQAQEAALAAFGVDPAPVVLSWTLTTQSVGDVLARVRQLAEGAVAVAPGPAATTGALVPGSPDAALIYVGTLTAPYYLGVPSPEAPTAPLTRFWLPSAPDFGEHLTGLNAAVGPEKVADQTMPLLLTIPRSDKPQGGWPVVVFQHGITSNRTALLGIADALALAGFAAVAVDLPLHGLPAGHPLRLPGVAERTFDLDLVNNETGAPGPDGVPDDSGTHFINLSSLLTMRDNLRQGVADLFALTQALETLDYDGGGADLDPSEAYFLGHSLGAIVGTPLLALEPGLRAAVLGMAGGGIAKLLDGSATIGPRLAAGLAANGILKGTADYESFFGVAQTALDPADPLNYATSAVTGRGVLLYEVLGDLVVPNNVLPSNPVLAPGTVPAVLAGTEPLIRAMSLAQVSETTPAEGLSPAPLRAWVGFTAGDHASLLSPAASLAATQVMQAAAATFLATDGGRIVIADETVVLGP
ncbi:MAG: Ig-like domain-containing protein [Deferrisomatales bacterium]|nr:Ig-like domain-containing protein [Deferrisomatales bacterium]